MRFCFFAILYVLSNWKSTVATESNNGTSTTTFVTLDTLETIDYSFFGEGMAYDRKRDRFILGSLDYGTLLAVPRSAAVGRNIQYSSEDVTMLLSSRPAAFNGSNFLGLTMDPVEDAVWGCISYGERRTYGVAKVNMKDNAVDFYDLTALANPSTGDHAVLNDLTFSPDGQFLYVTDTWGYQIIRVTVATGEAEVWNNGTSFCTQCLTTESHFDGPNGIVYVSSSLGVQCAPPHPEDFLLIGLGSSSNRLLKVNTTAPFLPPVEVIVSQSAGLLSQMDGLVLSSTPSSSAGSGGTLFVAGNGVNAVFALTSSDHWGSAVLRATFNANCPQNQPSALALVGDADIVCYCTNGFGLAPYPLTILTDGPARVVAERGIHLNLSSQDQLGGGAEYDGRHDRLVWSSAGAVKGVANSVSRGVQLTEMQSYEYFQGGGAVSALGGMKVDPAQECWLWAAVSSVPTGVIRIDLCSANQDTEPDLFIDLSQWTNSEFGSSASDLAIVGDSLFVTDSQGGYLWEVTMTDTRSYSVDVFLRFDPVTERARGIESTGDFLLISFKGDRSSLKRVDVLTKEQIVVAVSPNANQSSSGGLRFSASKDVLFMSSPAADSVEALVSCDYWISAQVATDFLASCGVPGSHVAVADFSSRLAVAGGDLWVVCSDNFSTGVSVSFNRIDRTVAKVYSGVYACSEQHRTDPSSTGGGDDDDSLSSDPLFWACIIAVALLVLVLMGQGCWWKHSAARQSNQSLRDKLLREDQSA